MTTDHTMTDTTKPTGDTIDDRAKVVMQMDLYGKGVFNNWEFAGDCAGFLVDALAEDGIGFTRIAERPNRAVARGDRDKIAQWFYNASNDQYADGFVPFERIGKQLRAVMYDFADELIDALITTPTETQEERS